MKIKIKRKVLKEDDTEKRVRPKPVKRPYKGPAAAAREKHGPLKGEPTLKTKKELPSSDIKPGEPGFKGIEMPEIPSVGRLGDEKRENPFLSKQPLDPEDEPTEDDTDYKGSRIEKEKKKKSYFATDIDDNPLLEVARRHFKKSK